MSEGTPLFCTAQQVPDPPSPHPHRCWHGGVVTRRQYEGTALVWGPPSHAQPHKPLPGTNPSQPLQAPVPLCPVPRESPRSAAVPIPASASSSHGSSMAASRRCWMCCPAQLTPSHCRGDELPPVPPQQGPPVLEPDPPSPAFLHRLCRPSQTPRAEGTTEHPESPAGPKAAGNRPAGPPRHLRGVRAQDSRVKEETEAEEALGRCSRVSWWTHSLCWRYGAWQAILDPHSRTKTQLPADAWCPPGPRSQG